MKKTIMAFIFLVGFLLSNTFIFAQSTDQLRETGTTKFTDVSGHWAQASVEKLAEKGAIPFSGDEFMPGKAITRSEFAEMLHKALDIQIEYFKAPNITDYFTDVEQDAPYASELIDLVTANILEGKGSFNPVASLSREEMVHYIMNAYKYKMGESYRLIKIDPSSFKDNDKINPLYSGDVARAAHFSLIQGSGDNLFSPDENTTRAQAVAVIEKLLNLLEKENPDIIIQPSAELKEDSLEMKLCIINHSEDPVTLTYSSGKKYDFVLLDSDKKELYRWSADKMFTMMVTSSVIEPGKSLEYVEVLNKDIYDEIKDKMVYLKAYLIGSSDSLSINAEGYEIKLN
jgi:hypothetical protein